MDQLRIPLRGRKLAPPPSRNGISFAAYQVLKATGIPLSAHELTEPISRELQRTKSGYASKPVTPTRVTIALQSEVNKCNRFVLKNDKWDIADAARYTGKVPVQPPKQLDHLVVKIDAPNGDLLPRVALHGLTFLIGGVCGAILAVLQS